MAINTIKATIQMRRGNEPDFDPDQMTAGEWAVSTDSKKVWMCFAPGIVRRMATYEAFEQDMEEIRNILATCQDIQVAVEAFERLAEQHKDDAEASRDAAALSEINADNYAKLSKSYAVGTDGEVRENDAVDNAEYYYQQSKRIAQGVNGIIPMGTISFADLSNPDYQVVKYMFNISDAFTSDERFNDGGGVYYGPGNNVIYTADEKWDVLAASAVTGIKGAAEKEYRHGNVNITASDVGIETATEENPGIMKPDGETTTVDPDGTLHVIGNEGTIDYDELENKPAINSVTLEGDKTLEEIGGASVIPLTKAEWEELPDTKYTDGKMYLVDDGSEESPGNPWLDLSEAINGVVLWQNPNVNVDYVAQNGIMSDNLTENYDHVEITFVQGIGYDYYFTTGKVKIGAKVSLILPGDGIFVRLANFEGNAFAFTDCERHTPASSEKFNHLIIPYQIIGHKKAEFNPINGILPPADKVTFDNTKSGLTSTDVQNAMDEAMREFDAYRKLDYSNQWKILENALFIDVGNPNADLNVIKWRLDINAGTINMPVGCAAGIREFYYFTDQFFILKITEVFPIVGRVWYNRYNHSATAWSGWTVVGGGINNVDVTPNPGVAATINAKRVGNLVSVNILTGWSAWNNSSTGNIIVGWIAMQPAVYISREAVFMDGYGKIAGVGLVNVVNTNIEVTTPINWENGAMAHIQITLAFLVDE